MARQIRDGVKILSVLRRAGPMGLARRLRGVLTPRTYCAYGVDVERPQAVPVSTLPGAVPRVGVIDELRAWRKSRVALPAPYFSDHIEGWRHFCWVLDKSEPVGIVWVSFSSPLIRMEPDEAAIVHLYTTPAFRGRGTGTALVRAACAHMRCLGVRRGYATVETTNIPSRQAFQAAGFQLLDSFTSHPLFRRPPSTARWRSHFPAGQTGVEV